MPIKIIWEEQGVLVKGFGEITASDLYTKVVEDYYKKEIKPVKYEIIDFTNTKNKSVTLKEVLFFVAHNLGRSYSNEKAHIALCYNSSEFEGIFKAFIREFKKCNTTWELCEFNNITNAREWIEKKLANNRNEK